MLEPVRESFRTGKSIAVDARPRPARLRLLQPQHPRQQGRRLHDLPRPGRSDAADVAGEVAADGVVPRLPPQSGALRAAARGGLPRRLRSRRRTSSSSASAWSPNIRFRNSRAARRATDEHATEPARLELGVRRRPATRPRHDGILAHARRAGRRSGVPGASAQRVPVAGSRRSPIRWRAARS